MTVPCVIIKLPTRVTWQHTGETSTKGWRILVTSVIISQLIRPICSGTSYQGPRFYCDQCDYAGMTPQQLNLHKGAKHEGKSMSVTYVTTKITIQLVRYTSNQSIQTLILLSGMNVTMKTVSLQPSGRITWLRTSRLSTNVWTTVVISAIIGLTGKAIICLLMCF